MTNTQIIIVCIAAASVAIALILRKSRFTLRVSKRGAKLDNKPPSEIPGIQLKGAVSKKGNITLEDHTGRGVKAEDLTADKDVTVQSEPSPKT